MPETTFSSSPARCELDPTPPPQLPNGLGHYFLPNCASFKVEWALDPHSDFVGGSNMFSAWSARRELIEQELEWGLVHGTGASSSMYAGVALLRRGES